MNRNVTQNYPALVAWTGAQANPVKLAGSVYFGFTFEVQNTLSDDVVFTLEAAPLSDSDPCSPGAFAPVMHLEACAVNTPSLTAQEETIKLAKGTAKGRICTGTLPCAPGAFIRLVSKSGPAKDVLATVTVFGKRV